MRGPGIGGSVRRPRVERETHQVGQIKSRDAAFAHSEVNAGGGKQQIDSLQSLYRQSDDKLNSQKYMQVTSHFDVHKANRELP